MYRYDAFISYKHGGLDQSIAERLHRALERYRVPSTLVKQGIKRRIERVFRDAEELAAGDLPSAISNALEQSNFLIVICSPRSRDSQWVQKEVEYFHGLNRGDNHILLLLVDGEPATAFPQKLHGTEHLAPDVRAENSSLSVARLKTEKLRLLAAILGCNFDDLRQRHQERHVRRLALLSVVSIGLVLAFAILTGFVFKYQQDAKREAAEAIRQEGIAKKNENEAIYLAGVAKTNEDEAVKQTGIAKTKEGIAIEKEIEAKKQTEIATKALKDLQYTVALDKIVLSQRFFESKEVFLARDELNKVADEWRKWEWHYLKSQFEGGIMTLDGHTHSVTGVAYSPDGRRIATSSADDAARIWDARTGLLLREMKETKGGVYSLYGIAFSPDGIHVAAPCIDTTTKIWDTRTGVLIRELKGHSSSVNSVAYSSDGLRILTVSHLDRTARIWDAKNGTQLSELKLQFMEGHAGVFSPDGTKVLIGGHSSFKSWDWKAATVSRTISAAHRNEVFGVCWSPDGTKIGSGSIDSTAKIWDVKTGDLIHELKGHSGPVTSVVFSPDGTRLASASRDRTARLWDVKTGQSLLELRGHADHVKSIAFSPDGLRVVTGGGEEYRRDRNEYVAKIWDARTGTHLVEYKAPSIAMPRQWKSPDGTRIAKTEKDRTTVADVKSGALLYELQGIPYGAQSAAFTTDGKWLVTGGADRIVRIWNANSGKLRSELKGHANLVSSVLFNRAGDRVLTASWDNTAKLWSVETGAPLLDLKGHTDQLTAAIFNHDETRIVTAGHDSTIRIWDARTGAPLLELKRHPKWIFSISFSNDGQQIIAHYQDREAVAWDARTGQESRGKPGDGEREYRREWTRPRPDLHKDEFDKAKKADDRFAACFHLERLLAELPAERLRWFGERNRLLRDDLLVQARTAAHTPKAAFATVKPDTELATSNDPFITRLRAGVLLRRGKLTEAIEAIKEAIAKRGEDKPPVEELLLAIAYLQTRQFADASKNQKAAIAWLDLYRDRMRLMTAIGLVPGGISRLPFELCDPRYNSLDWETWYECDMFRAEIVARVKALQQK